MATYTVTTDTYVDENSPTTSYGTATTALVGDRPGFTREKRTFLYTDLSAISGHFITDAKLWIYVDSFSEWTTKNVIFRRLTSSFSNSSTWNAQPSSTTTNQATKSIANTDTGWVSIDVTDLANDILNNTNYGIGIYDPGTGSGSNNEYMYIQTTENASGNDPYLEITSFEISKLEIEHCVDDDTEALYFLADTTDESSNSNDLTNNGSAVFTGTGFDGTANNAVVLNGSSQYLTTTTLWSSATTNITMECWFKTDDYTDTEQTIMTNGRATGAGNGYSLLVNGNSSTNGNIYLLDHGVAWYDTGTGVTDSNYHHIALVLDGSGNPYIYLDGVLIYSNTGVTMGVPTQGSGIGFENGSTRYFDGTIDSAKFSTRAKSSEEIAKYYSGTVSARFDSTEARGVYYSSGTSWSAARSAATGDGTRSGSNQAGFIQSEDTGTTWDITRNHIPVDTSTLPSSFTATAATLYIYNSGNGELVESTYPADQAIVESTISDPSSITTADYDAFGTTKYNDTDLAISTFNNTNQYHSIALNSTGLSAISGTGYTLLGLRASNDFSDATEPTARSYSRGDYGDGTNPPYLWVEYVGSQTLTADVSSTTNISESITVDIQKVASVSDTINLSEVISNAGSTYNASYDDTVNVSDSQTTSRGIIATVVDTLNLSDALTVVTSYAKTVVDTINISEVLSGFRKRWEHDSKPSSSYTNDSKPSDSWTNDSK